MRIIMLDLDGVLNDSQSSTMYWRKAGKQCVFLDETMFNPVSCSNLQTLLEAHPDLKIVLSSTWRKTRELNYLESVFQKFWGIDDLKFIGKTPQLHRARGFEIFDWLKDNMEKESVTDMLIIDDDEDMAMFRDTPFFLHVDSNIGFDYYAREKAEKFFKEDHSEMLRAIVSAAERYGRVEC